MRVFNYQRGLDFCHEDIPKFAILQEGTAYIPLVRYTSGVNSTLYLFANDDMSQTAFEHHLVRQHGKSALYPNAIYEIMDWSCFSHVTNQLDMQDNIISYRDIMAVYTPQDEGFKIGPKSAFEPYELTTGHIIKLVTGTEFEEIEQTTTRVFHTKFDALDIRPALNVEMLSTTPILYILGARLTTCLGVTLDFLAMTRKSKSLYDLSSEIARQYKLTDSNSYNIGYTPLLLEYYDWEFSDDNANITRIDKYAPLVDFARMTVQLRSIRNVNPVHASVNHELPPLSANHRLMPVYRY